MIKKTLQIIHDNRGQGSALRSKDLKTQELTRPDTTCTFLDPCKTRLFNLINQPSEYLGLLFKFRLKQNNHIMQSSGNIKNTMIW